MQNNDINTCTNVIPFSDIEKMARAVSASGLFGIKKPEEALALMLIAQAENMHPAIAARDYHIIKGKPALKADAMLSRFQASGGSVKWIKLTDTECEAEFTHPRGGSAAITWDIERAKKAEVYRSKNADGSTGMWVKYPRQMLRSRVVSEGIRTVFPGVVVGIYTPEEVADMDDRPAPIAHPTPGDNDGSIAPLTELRAADEVTAICGKPETVLVLPEKKDGTISAAQLQRLHAIASGVPIDTKKGIIKRHGFDTSKDITVDKYDAIITEIEGAKNGI